ncbi:hypothetical protein V3C33_17010 [Micrococcaceae bacterium Sec5.7]
MKKQLGIGFTVLALAAALTGCGGGAGTTPTSAPAGTASASEPAPSESASATATTSESATADLKTATSSAGKIVVDGKGMSVYHFTKDVKDSGKSNCSGDCLVVWPPVFTTNDTPVVDGVTGTVGTITTADGKKQVTVNGMPVYYFHKDKAEGDINGQGVKDVWYLVSPAGEMIK